MVRTSGAYGPDELLVEQLLLGNARVARALRERVVDVLLARDPSGAVVSTLRRYLATGWVPETARLEVVHPNTVTYRLGRVRDLTGLDLRPAVGASSSCDLPAGKLLTWARGRALPRPALR